MNTPEPMTAEEVARWKALDLQPVTLRQSVPTETPDGVPVGVETTEWAPATFVVPWGRHGFPSRAEVYGPEDAA